MYPRAKLVNERGQPLRVRASSWRGLNYVFDYPFAATPCFLLRLRAPAHRRIDLRTETGFPYRWEGGVGPARDVVAYSAICAHKMTYPTRQVSFIGYRDGAQPHGGQGQGDHLLLRPQRLRPGGRRARGLGARRRSRSPRSCSSTTRRRTSSSRSAPSAAKCSSSSSRSTNSACRWKWARARATPVEGTAVVRELESYSTQWAKC